MMPTPDYEELSAVLNAVNLDLTAAEVHGLITGAVCFSDPPGLARLLLGQASSPSPHVQPLLDVAQSLQDDVRRRLEETEFEFEPLLGNAELPEQVERLGAWARGFVMGLAAGGLHDARQLRGDAGEFLLDAVSIGEAEMDDDGDTERQEQEVAELVEYLRVGVQLVYEELRAGG